MATPAATASAGLATCTALAGKGDPAPIAFVGMENGARDLGPAGTDEPGQGDDLAGPDLEMMSLKMSRLAQPLDAKERPACLGAGAPLGARAARCPAIIVTSSPRGSSLTARVVTRTPIAQHRHPVGDAVDLLQAMRDVEDARPDSSSGSR